MSREVQAIIDSAKEELRERVRDYPQEDTHDIIFEIADSSVPVYTADILDLLNDSEYGYSLGIDVPELGPAFDGAANAPNIIAANLYELVSNELHELERELSS